MGKLSKMKCQSCGFIIKKSLYFNPIIKKWQCEKCFYDKNDYSFENETRKNKEVGTRT